MSSRPSIKDIAAHAGVAPSTVSRALAGSARISERTRQRVQTIAQTLGYTPSATARSLVTGASHLIGLITPSLADPYAAAVVSGIETAAAAHDYRLLIATSHGDPEQEIAGVRLLLGQQVDGLIVLSSRAGPAYRPLLPALDIPTIFVNSDQPGEQVYSIATDNEQGGWLATRHLLACGHRRIAYLGGPAAGRSQQARLAGYRRALRGAGAPYEPALILPGDGSSASGQAALAALLALPAEKRPTALFCYNDLSALGLLAAAHAHGLAIPAQLSVIGFDNLPYAALSLPPLTTIDQRKDEMGRLAVETILAARAHEPVSDIHLPGELIPRHTTAPPPPN